MYPSSSRQDALGPRLLPASCRTTSASTPFSKNANRTVSARPATATAGAGGPFETPAGVIAPTGAKLEGARRCPASGSVLGAARLSLASSRAGVPRVLVSLKDFRFLKEFRLI